MSVLVDEVYTTCSIADRLGIPRQHVCSWAVIWHGRHTPAGPSPRRLTGVDMCVARAWQVLGGAFSGVTGHYGRTPPARYLLAETAIRDRPRRWLLIAGDIAQTYHHAETAALAWAGSGQPAGQVIDLWSAP